MARDSIAMNAIIHERNNVETIKQQLKMREQAKIDGKINAKRIEEIRKIQENLREKFIESNEFIRECSEKELGAQKKIDIEHQLQIKLQTEIDELKGSIENLNKFHDEFKAAIIELRPYEDVLEQVVDEMELFTSKRDLLDRCDAICMCSRHFFTKSHSIFFFSGFLVLAHGEATQNDKKYLELIKKMQANMVKMSNEAMLIIAGLDNQLSAIQVTINKL